MVELIGQLGQDHVEAARLLANPDHFNEDGREEIVRFVQPVRRCFWFVDPGSRKGVGERLTPFDGPGNPVEPLPEVGPLGPTDLLAQDASRVDARLQRDGQSATQFRERFQSDAWREQHGSAWGLNGDERLSGEYQFTGIPGGWRAASPGQGFRGYPTVE
jgi:hypothetical protein